MFQSANSCFLKTLVQCTMIEGYPSICLSPAIKRRSGQENARPFTDGLHHTPVVQAMFEGTD